MTILETLDMTECHLTPSYVIIGFLPDGREVGYFPADGQFDEKIVIEISVA